MQKVHEVGSRGAEQDRSMARRPEKSAESARGRQSEIALPVADAVSTQSASLLAHVLTDDVVIFVDSRFRGNDE